MLRSFFASLEKSSFADTYATIAQSKLFELVQYLIGNKYAARKHSSYVAQFINSAAAAES